MRSPSTHFIRLCLLVFAGTTFASACAAPSRSEPRSAASLATDTDALKATVASMNSAMTARDLQAAMDVFEASDDILLVGSDKGEVYRGREAIRGFLAMLMGLPFTFTFETPTLIARVNSDTAWFYVDGFMVHTKNNGSSTRKAYRFAICAIRQSAIWRWQLFHGSIPGAE